MIVRRMMLILTIMMLLSLSLFGKVPVLSVMEVQAAGNIHYVDDNGSNGNGGTGPADAWKTITYAISQAESGDTIIVAPGTYDTDNGETFPIIISQNNLTLQSSDGASVTIVDGGGIPHEVFKYDSGSAGLLDGFTIDNTSATWYCITTDEVSSLIITNNIIFGAGHICVGLTDTSATISDNVIYGTTSSNGAGIRYDDCSVRITRNIISDTASGIYCSNSYTNQQIIANNLIYNNRAHGIYCSWSQPVIVNNTIDSNYIGIGCYGDSPTITNNIITNNTLRGIDDCDGTISYNNVYGNGTNYYDCSAGTGDISLVPLFIGSPDYHLQAASPCVDTGYNAATNSAGLSTDLDKNIRIWDGNGDTIVTVDMGAYEFGAPPSPYVIDVQAEPTIISACSDDVSTITATILDAAGGPVADGIAVVFTTDLGSIGSSTVTKYTSGGEAVATLEAGMSPGTATITVQSSESMGITAVTLTSELCPEEEPTPTPEPPPPSVGGEAYPINKIGLIIPWIALAVALAASGFYLIRRRIHN